MSRQKMNWDLENRLQRANRNRLKHERPLTLRQLAISMLTMADYTVLAGRSTGRPAQRLKLRKMDLLNVHGRLTALARSLLPASIQPIVANHPGLTEAISAWRDRADEIRWKKAMNELQERKQRTLKRLRRKKGA